ncbi:MAG: HD domain-containing protein [Flavobacteriaceae bacterium]|nr:HD domain-containing protein [Flavobacteriaceae bacterium]
MKSTKLLKQIEFVKEIDKLKYINRKTKLFGSNRNENDAEHSWHLCMMAIVFLEHSNEKVDTLKVLKMLLIHDLVEIYAGDTFLFDSKKNHSNTKEELIAAKRIFGILPEDQFKEFIELWKEFEKGETKEAKFAKTMDRFEPVLQNVSNKGGTWAEFNISYEKVIDRVKVIGRGSEVIWNYTQEIIKNLYSKINV